MPGAGRHGQLLTGAERALLAVGHETDLAALDLEVLVAVVVDVLAAGHEPALLHDEIHDDAFAPVSSPDSTSIAFSPVERVPDDVAGVHRR